MHHDLILTFCDPITKENEYDIPFVLADNSTAPKWLKIIYKDIYVNKINWNNDRYVGFETNKLTKKKMAEELNELIFICEKERPGHFQFTAHENMSQDDFNKMHVWFETYRGPIFEPHPFFINGSKKFRYAIERFNELIHMWERIDQHEKNKNSFLVNFDISGRAVKFEEDDFLNFKLKRYDNTIYLSYIMRGKNLVDVWVDDDIYVGDHNIRPFNFLGSSFVLSSGAWTDEKTKQRKKDFEEWFDRNSNFLNSLGFSRNDPKNTVGWIPLAHSTIQENIKSIIEPRQFLKRIKIFEDLNDNRE